MKRGEVKDTILKALESGEKYGWEIIKAIEKLSDGKIVMKQPSLYSALSRLETAGLVTSYWVDSSIGGKRHYYKLTENNQDEKTTTDIIENKAEDIEKQEIQDEKTQIKEEIIEQQPEITKAMPQKQNEKSFGIKVQENQADIFSLLQKSENEPESLNKAETETKPESKIEEQLSDINEFDAIFNQITKPEKSFIEKEPSPVKKLVSTANLEESDLLYGNFELKNELESTFKDFDLNASDKNDDVKDTENNIDIKNIFKEFLNEDERINENPLHENIEEKSVAMEQTEIESAFLKQPVDLNTYNNVNISLIPKAKKEEDFYSKKSLLTKEEIPTLNSSFKFKASKKVENKLRGLTLKEHKKINKANYKSKLFDNYKTNLIAIIICLLFASTGILITFFASYNTAGLVFTAVLLGITTLLSLFLTQFIFVKKTYQKYNFKKNIIFIVCFTIMILIIQVLAIFINFDGNYIKFIYLLLFDFSIILFPVIKMLLFKMKNKKI